VYFDFIYSDIGFINYCTILLICFFDFFAGCLLGTGSEVLDYFYFTVSLIKLSEISLLLF